MGEDAENLFYPFFYLFCPAGYIVTPICSVGIVREFVMDVYVLLYLKWITNKDLLYSTGDSA